MDANKPVTPERIMQWAWGYAPVLIIETAVRLRIFDRLHPTPRTLAELVAETGASLRGLRALLNSLVGLELLARDGEKYYLTPESTTYLVSTQPDYRGSFFHHHRDQLLPLWLQLPEVVRSGHPAVSSNREVGGAEYFAAFVEALFPVNYPAAQALGRHLGIPGAAQPVNVLDIGAGSGVWGIALAQQSPRVRVLAIDFPQVLEVTRRMAARHGVADRLSVSAGDFLSADLGQGHQVATLGHILHSEGPDRNRQLLRKTFDALAPGGVIAIQEFVPNDERTGPPHPLIFAVNMLVNTESGDTYTFAEMSQWLQEAGFANPRLLDVPGAPSPLVLADKPGA